MSNSDRADLYALLAETLAEPPDWMSLPGREWPLFDTVSRLASEFESARHHLDRLTSIPPEEIHLRQGRYTAIFASGKPRFWLYESAALTGKILGPQTFELAQLYRAAGLEAVGAELPDHISLQLAFLSHIAGSSWEMKFLESHATWMIELGRTLSRYGDEIYSLIGSLLADWLEFSLAPPPLQTKQGNRVMIPTLPRPDDCTLCGFCVQICPTYALKVLEDAQQTMLVLEVADCIHCGKCNKICEFNALKMGIPAINNTSMQSLRQSQHVQCQNCGQLISSQAEMDYIISQIGKAAWQHLCPDCRPGLFV